VRRSLRWRRPGAERHVLTRTIAARRMVRLVGVRLSGSDVAASGDLESSPSAEPACLSWPACFSDGATHPGAGSSTRLDWLSDASLSTPRARSRRSRSTARSTRCRGPAPTSSGVRRRRPVSSSQSRAPVRHAHEEARRHRGSVGQLLRLGSAGSWRPTRSRSRTGSAYGIWRRLLEYRDFRWRWEVES
jgi:hypothetical protein